MPRRAESLQDVAAAPAPTWLAGRERVWKQLTVCLAAASRGVGGIVTVSGEAGIGKTALIEALAVEARQAGAIVLVGGCYDLTLTPPYGPWSEAFASYRALDGLPSLPATLRDSSSATDASGQALYEQVRAVCAEIAARRPLLILLEDLHWADAASLELLRSVGRRLDGLALLIVATWRDDEATRQQPLYRVLPALVRETQPTRIDLQRLQAGDMRDLVAERYRLPIEEQHALAAWVQRHAEGNPFFAGEVLLALEQGGALRPDGDLWHFAPPAAFNVPPLARHVIEQRLTQLSGTTQRLLEYAAILGQDAALSLVQAAGEATDGELVTALEEALAARVVVEPSVDELNVRFRHALVRETLYERQMVLRLRARHRRVAEILLAGPSPVPVTLAYHFQAANDPRAVAWLAHAGERSLALYAPHDAITHLTHAAELARRYGTQLPPGALRARGQAWEMAGDYAQARADYDECLRVTRAAGDRRAEWQALLDLGALWAERDYGRAGTAFQQALALAREELDDGAIAHSLNAVGNWYGNREETQAALRCHADALVIFTQLGALHSVAVTRDLLAVAHYLAGNIQRAAQEYEQAAQLLNEFDDRQRLASALATWATTGGNFETDAVVVPDGSFEDWLEINARARALAREIGWLAGQAYAEIQAGAILGPRGYAGQSLALANAGMALAGRIGHQQWIVSGHVTLGRIYADLLDAAPARAHLEAALAQSHALGSRYWVTMSVAALGSLLVDLGDLDAATAVMDTTLSAGRPAETLSQRRCRLAWAQLLLARGEPDDAFSVVEQLIASAPNAAGPRSLPWLALARGDACAALGRSDEAEANYDAARLGALGLEYRHLLWRVELAHARLLRGVGRIAESIDACERARRTVDAIAATLAEAEQRVAFRRRALARFPASETGRADPSVAGGLSPREIEVLRLVARGLTDLEVGERLYISHRTVGRHLQSVYNKLGVGSRTAAVAFAFEHNLVNNPTEG